MGNQQGMNMTLLRDGTGGRGLPEKAYGRKIILKAQYSVGDSAATTEGDRICLHFLCHCWPLYTDQSLSLPGLTCLNKLGTGAREEFNKHWGTAAQRYVGSCRMPTTEPQGRGFVTGSNKSRKSKGQREDCGIQTSIKYEARADAGETFSWNIMWVKVGIGSGWG